MSEERALQTTGAAPAVSGEPAAEGRLEQIRELRRSDPDAYRDRRRALEAEEMTLLEGEVAARKTGDRGKVAQVAADGILGALSKSEGQALERGFQTLPRGARDAIGQELASGGLRTAPASRAAMQRFGSTPETKAVADAWGHLAAIKIGRVQARAGRALLAMESGDAEAALDWFARIPAEQAVAILRSLAE